MTAQPIRFIPANSGRYTWRQLINRRAKVDYLEGMAMQFVSTAQVACLAARLTEQREGNPKKMLSTFLTTLGDDGRLRFSVTDRPVMVAQQRFADSLRAPDNWFDGLNDAIATLDRDLAQQDGRPLNLKFTRAALPANKVFKPITWDRAEDQAWEVAQELCMMNALPSPF